MKTEYFRIGQIVRPHGVKGYVKVIPTTDDPLRFSDLRFAYLELHGKYIPVQICVHSITMQAVLVSIDGFSSPEDASKLRGTYLCVDRKHAISLPSDTYFISDLIGCEVFDSDGKRYGQMTNVYQTGANDVYEIENGALSVPALKKLLKSVDLEKQRIEFHADILQEVGLFAD